MWAAKAEKQLSGGGTGSPLVVQPGQQGLLQVGSDWDPGNQKLVPGFGCTRENKQAILVPGQHPQDASCQPPSPAQKPNFLPATIESRLFLEKTPRRKVHSAECDKAKPEHVSINLHEHCFNVQKPLPSRDKPIGAATGLPASLSSHPGQPLRMLCSQLMLTPGSKTECNLSIPQYQASWVEGGRLFCRPCQGGCGQVTRSCKQPHAPPPGCSQGQAPGSVPPTQHSPATCGPHVQTH